MSAGIIITSGDPVGVLTKYYARCLSGTGVQLGAASGTYASAAEATEKFVAHYRGSVGVLGWVAGTGADKRTTQRLKLAYRVRAPGGGRPAKEPSEKSEAFTVQLKPAEIARIKAAAERNNRAYGVEIAARFP